MSTLEDESFHLNLSAVILLVANLLNLDSAYCQINYKHLSIVSYINEIQKIKTFLTFHHSEPDC